MKRAVVAMTFLVPLLVWPDAEGPFWTPKLVLLGVSAGAVVLLAAGSGDAGTEKGVKS